MVPRTRATNSSKPSGILGIFKKAGPMDLKIAVLVSSENVRHKMSIQLRNRIQQFVTDWNADPENPILELGWEDDLEIVP